MMVGKHGTEQWMGFLLKLHNVYGHMKFTKSGKYEKMSGCVLSSKETNIFI